MKFWPGIPLFQAVAPVRAREFFSLGDISGSGGFWDMAGAWLVRIGVEDWVFCEFYQGFPCFGPWLLLGIVHFLGFGGVSGSRWIWEEAGACIISNGGEEWV